MSKGPTIELVSSQEVDQLLDRVRPRIEPADFQLLERVIKSLKWIQEVIALKNLTLSRLKRFIFGAQTEKTSNLVPTPPAGAAGSEAKPADASSPSSDSTTQQAGRPKRKGHGRNGVEDYPGAAHKTVAHQQHRVGDPCPSCNKGKLHHLADPGTIIHIVAQPIFAATIYDLEKLRCGLCGQLFTAKPPAEAGTQKYDPTVGSMNAVLCYGSGMPFYRIEKLQDSFGVPMPSSTQWELVEEVAQDAKPVFQELQWQAAQTNLIHVDDTGMSVLSLRQEIAKESAEDSDSEPKRTGIFTTSIVAISGERRIALYFTGRKYAGENLNQLLKLRDPNLPPPILMCDALSRNLPEDFKIILANCNAHSRRGFADVVLNFPQECRFVLESLRDVYRNDAQCKEQRLSPEARLTFHQEKSKLIMDKLHQWMDEQMENKRVEPNSGLGQAIRYMRKHWQALTLFLRKAGAPLDNNVCERSLKRAILHRKNSYHYKTSRGAEVGDLFMSLINTCEFQGVNPFDYLTALQRNRQEVKAHPKNWLPWNYPKGSDTS